MGTALLATERPAHARFLPVSLLLLLLCTCISTLAQQENPKRSLGSFATGWTYLYADQGAGERESINGWFLRPSVNVGKDFNLFLSNTNYYGTNRKGSLNSHALTLGVGHTIFATPHVKPSIFAESGDVRSSNAGNIVNQFAFATGFGLTIPLSKHIDLTLTPAEYVFLYPKGDPRTDFNAKVGFSFPFGHR